jgi:hypothetical protein
MEFEHGRFRIFWRLNRYGAAIYPETANFGADSVIRMTLAANSINSYPKGQSNG